MVDYLRGHYGNRPSINEGERMELDFLRKEVQRLNDQVKALGSPNKGQSTASDKHGGSSSEDSEADEQVEELPQK